MQSLDVISVNIWSILISLANLLILYLLIKKFLFKPVNKMLDKRQEKIDNLYGDAKKAKDAALEEEAMWRSKMDGAAKEAQDIVEKATDKASRRTDKMLSQAQKEADDIIRQAQKEADMELKKAGDTIKQEIIDVSFELAEKVLSREINRQDHRRVVDSVIDKIGDNNEFSE